VVDRCAGNDTTMATGDDTKLPLTSRDVHAERLAQFRELFPEAFTEGKTDLKKLAQLLGDAATDAPERYGLSWSGKSEAIRAIQITSPGTLRPCVEESWPPLPFAAEVRARHSARAAAGTSGGGAQGTDAPYQQNTSENLIIEGDNLETLKLLQGGYHGRVKMIYIDPPYNTGGEFIYPDNYKEGLADYLRFSGQVSGEGIKLTTNAETDGRYHSKWLTMMYPRLFLARNLLREDGVIFVSIDDHEVHNLRAVMNEIFGEENYVTTIVWQRRDTPANDVQGFSTYHEYILCYAKQIDAVTVGLVARTQEQIDIYKNPDNDSRGVWTRSALTRPGSSEKDSYAIKNPTGREVYPPKGTSWRVSKETLKRFVEENRLWWGATGDGDMPFQKRFLTEVKQGVVPTTWWDYKFAGSMRNAKNEIREIFEDPPFDYPKPSSFVRRILEISTYAKEEDLILDFFGGSGTTAQAVLELNAQDGGNRKFILVQLPEPTERKDFPTIADITKERVRRVIQKLSNAKAQSSQDAKEELKLGDAAPAPESDLGFKVFKLGSSNFKVWDAASAPKDGTALAEQLKLIAHNVEDGRPDDALLYELVLKSNLPLTSKITAGKIGGQTFYDVANGTLAICLERPIQQETLRGLIARKPKCVICLDIAFAGNDQLKANTVLEMKSHGIEFHTA
jgi:adenine-specific DNA-methyltransferase